MSMKPNIWMGYITQASIAKNHLRWTYVRKLERGPQRSSTESAKYLLARNRDNN